MQQPEEIVVRLKPQKPTFTGDDDDDDDDISESQNKDNIMGKAIKHFRPNENANTSNLSVGELNGEPTIDKIITKKDNKSESPSASNNTNILTGKNSTHVHKTRSPPIASVDIDNLLQKEINELKGLSDLEPIAAMAIFQRLVEDLMKLHKKIEENPQNSIDIRSLLFEGMGDILIDHQEMRKKVENFKANGSSGSLDNVELKNPFPVMLKEEMMEMANVHKAQHQNLLQKYKSRSNEQLEIPLKQKSKIDSNFDELANLSLDSHDFKNASGCYHINIDSKRHEELCSKFYLKKAPTLSVNKYLERINKLLCPSTASLLTAAYFLFHTVFNLKPSNNMRVVPLGEPPKEEGDIHMSSVNNRNVFRLILGSLRVSLKLIEDKNYKQRYYCKVVGMQNMSEMLNLELAEMFMLNFHLFINEYVLTRFLFQFKVFDHNARLLFASAE